MGVSLNGDTPKTLQNDYFFGRQTGKPHGPVGETHHFRKPPYNHNILSTCAGHPLPTPTSGAAPGIRGKAKIPRRMRHNITSGWIESMENMTNP